MHARRRSSARPSPDNHSQNRTPSMKTTRCLPILLAALSAGVSCPADEHPVQKYAWSFRNFRSDPCVPGSAFYDWDLYMQTYIGIPAEPANNQGFDYLWFKAA